MLSFSAIYHVFSLPCFSFLMNVIVLEGWFSKRKQASSGGLGIKTQDNIVME